jgi:hypothetical protein
MSIVHLINHTDFGQLQIPDPEYVRVDREDDCEFYVTIIHGGFEELAWSLHESAVDAEDSAARLARHLRCDWGTNYSDDKSS